MTVNSKKIYGVSLAILAFSFTSSITAAQTCVTPPTCAAMGYKQKLSDCGNRAVLRCPFALTDDNQVFCTAYTDANGNEQQKAGDILFSDMSWGPAPRSDKRAIGIIVDGPSRLAINLHSIELPWGGYDKPLSLSLGTDGKYNTQKIVEALAATNYTRQSAAKYCNTYETTGTTRGSWYLPSEYEFSQIIAPNLYAINLGLDKVSGANLPSKIRANKIEIMKRDVIQCVKSSNSIRCYNNYIQQDFPEGLYTSNLSSMRYPSVATFSIRINSTEQTYPCASNPCSSSDLTDVQNKHAQTLEVITPAIMQTSSSNNEVRCVFKF